MNMRASFVVLLLASCVDIASTSRPVLDPTTPWAMHVVRPGPGGADGVDLADVNGDGRSDVVTAWEDSGLVTLSVNPGPDASRDPWPTVVVGSGLVGAEDAILADVDMDGNVDAITACETCRRVVVHYGPNLASLFIPSAWTSVTLSSSVNLQRWMKTAVGDIDGDGRLDILAGGKVNPATVGWFRGPSNPRTGTAWIYNPIGQVAWTMSLEAWDADGDGDRDVLLSDRTYIINPDGTRNYTLTGSRWLDNGNGWVNRPIGPVQGDAKFLRRYDIDRDGDEDIVDGRSSPTIGNVIRLKTAPSWSTLQLPQPPNVGQYQGAAVGDVNGDGEVDIVYSYAAADGALEGIAVSFGPTLQESGVVSGALGTKFDNLELDDVDNDGDLDIITSEQLEDLGVVWFENELNAASEPDAGAPDAAPPDAALCLCPCEDL